MLEGRFRGRWLEIRAEAITRIATAAAQADGFCPGIDPVLTAPALSAMLEHFCYIWLGQGGEKECRSTTTALDTLATIWVKSVYWRPEAPGAEGLQPPVLNPGAAAAAPPLAEAPAPLPAAAPQCSSPESNRRALPDISRPGAPKY